MAESTARARSGRRLTLTPLAGRLLEPVQEIEIAQLQVVGMGCAACAARIRAALVSDASVLGANVCHRSGIAEILYDKGRTNVDRLCQIVSRVASMHEGPFSAHPHPEDPFPFPAA